MIPALFAVASAGLGAYYTVGQFRDNKKYWNDYYRNTGRRPRYAYKSGSYDWMKYGARSLGSIYGVSKIGQKPVRQVVNRNHYHYNYSYTKYKM